MRGVCGLAASALIMASALSVSADMPCSIRPPKNATKSELARLATLSRPDAEKIARETLGRAKDVSVTDAGLEVEDTCLVWSFELEVKGTPGVAAILVDAGDGKVLSSRHENARREAGESGNRHQDHKSGHAGR